jgi:hypothetical protein
MQLSAHTGEPYLVTAFDEGRYPELMRGQTANTPQTAGTAH